MLLSASFYQPLGALLFMCIVTSVWLLNNVYLHLNHDFPTFGVHALKAVSLADRSAANRTLGFQTIFAVSGGNVDQSNAWRRDGLIKASNRTGLDIAILSQPNVLYDDMKKLMYSPAADDEEPKSLPNEGQARAWLAHLYVLDHIIEHNISSALILEDDADWDVSIRSRILPVASAIQTLTQNTFDPTTINPNPYGTNWDILWLGHCGSSSLDTDLSTPIPISDPSILPLLSLRKVFHPFTYKNFDLPPHTRFVHRTRGPICTFGYAVTLDSAKKIREYASNTDEAYDVRLSHGCNKGLKCLTTTPELIHHQRNLESGSLSTGDQTTTMAGTGDGNQRSLFTMNIKNSARCNWDRGDDELIECLPNEEQWKRFITK